jgi:hypothetical protein
MVAYARLRTADKPRNAKTFLFAITGIAAEPGAMGLSTPLQLPHELSPKIFYKGSANRFQSMAALCSAFLFPRLQLQWLSHANPS